MKHSYIIASLWLLALSFVSLTAVSADSTGSTSTGSVMTWVVGTGMKHEQRHEDRLNMIETIHQNWKDTIDDNGSGTKAFLDASTKIRQETTAACKVAVDQFKAGTLTKDAALTQCKELKKKMQDTIKTMRKDLQAARKAAREATKQTNQWMRKDFKEKYGLGSGNMWTWNMWSGKRQDMEHRPETKEFKENHKEDKCVPMWSGSTMWSGTVWSGTTMCKPYREELKTEKKAQKEELKLKKEELKMKKKEEKRINKDEDDKEDKDHNEDHHSWSGSTNTGVVLPIV